MDAEKPNWGDRIGSVQGTLAVMITIVILGMYAKGISVPNELLTIWGMVLAFYFGNKK